MKKLCLSILASLALTLGLVSQVQADEYLRIGMEAAYAPFNWTQDDDSNGRRQNRRYQPICQRLRCSNR